MLPDRAPAHRPDDGDRADVTNLISVARLCDLCRGRLDAVLTNAGRHPGCGPYEPISETAYERLISALTTELGATTITKEIR